MHYSLDNTQFFTSVIVINGRAVLLLHTLTLHQAHKSSIGRKLFGNITNMATTKRKHLWVNILMILVLLTGGIGIFNYASLQMPLTKLIDGDPRNAGICVTAHYGSYVNTSVLIYDMAGITGEKSHLDVFRVFCQYAHEMKDHTFHNIILAHNGKPRFQLEGSYFHQIGAEYGTQNLDDTIRSFTQHLYYTDGARAFGQGKGGLLGVVDARWKDFSTFHDQWYLDDIPKDPADEN